MNFLSFIFLGKFMILFLMNENTILMSYNPEPDIGIDDYIII